LELLAAAANKLKRLRVFACFCLLLDFPNPDFFAELPLEFGKVVQLWICPGLVYLSANHLALLQDFDLLVKILCRYFIVGTPVFILRHFLENWLCMLLYVLASIFALDRSVNYIPGRFEV
jgi:hypothetical protein